jgi:hypothetical protein
MSSHSATLTPPGVQAPVAAEQTESSSARKARAGMAMSMATFAMAAASAIQAVLYLGRFGTNDRTDGFFIAFALYSTFGVFSQSLRLTSVPLLVQPGARLSGRQFAATLGFLALLVLIVTVALAHPLAHLIAPGLSAQGRSVTASALPVLGFAMIFQLWAAGGATVLAIRSRFNAIATAYMAGAGIGLVAFLALMGSAGEQTLGWSMLAMALVTCGFMLTGVKRSGGLEGADSLAGLKLGARLATLSRDAVLVLGRTVVYLAFNVLFVITVAFASHATAGGTTVLSYAYLFASYLVAGTGMALGMSSISDLTRQARAREAVFTDALPQGFRFSMMIVAPALAALIVAGAPLVHAVLPGSLSSSQVHSLRTFVGLLVPWTIFALLVNFLLPVMFALGRTRLLNLLALPLVLAHIAATALGSFLFGVDGAVGAFFVAPACFAVVLLATGAGEDIRVQLALQLASVTIRFLVVAIVAFGIGWALGATLSAPFAQAVVGGAVGVGLYLAGLRQFARPQLEVLLGALSSRPSTA